MNIFLVVNFFLGPAYAVKMFLEEKIQTKPTPKIKLQKRKSLKKYFFFATSY